MEAVNPQQVTLPVVVSAALVDSINPCAFAVLLTFIAATLVLAERASARGARARWFLWRMGMVYVAGIFLTYLGLGLGLLGFASAFGQTHWVSRVAGPVASPHRLNRKDFLLPMSCHSSQSNSNNNNSAQNQHGGHGGKMGLLMALCCLAPLAGIIAVTVFGVPLSGLFTIALVLLCPLMMVFMMGGGHAPASAEPMQQQQPEKTDIAA
jgi:cytochrome c biogenesis protein CcdA